MTRGMSGESFPDEPKTSSVEAIQAKRQAIAENLHPLRRLQLMPSLPDNTFMRRRQEQLEAEEPEGGG